MSKGLGNRNRERSVLALGQGGSWSRLPGGCHLADHSCSNHLLSIDHRCLGAAVNNRDQVCSLMGFRGSEFSFDLPLATPPARCLPRPPLTSVLISVLTSWYRVINRQMAPVLSCIHGWALVALAWDLLSLCMLLIILSPPGSLPGSPVSSPWPYSASFMLSHPREHYVLGLHKLMDDLPSLDSTFCPHEGREYLGFVLFPSMFAELVSFCLVGWFALFLMNECILEEKSLRSTSWFWSCFSSQITATWDKPISPSEPLFLL